MPRLNVDPHDLQLDEAKEAAGEREAVAAKIYNERLETDPLFRRVEEARKAVIQSRQRIRTIGRLGCLLPLFVGLIPGLSPMYQLSPEIHGVLSPLFLGLAVIGLYVATIAWTLYYIFPDLESSSTQSNHHNKHSSEQ